MCFVFLAKILLEKIRCLLLAHQSERASHVTLETLFLMSGVSKNYRSTIFTCFRSSFTHFPKRYDDFDAYLTYFWLVVPFYTT